MFLVEPRNWITPPNKLVNPLDGNPGHMRTSRFALLVQVRQSMIFNGLALSVIHSAMTGASKALKGRFIYPLKAAAIGALANATLYTAFLDGRSWYSSRDFRFEKLKTDYTRFLHEVGIAPREMIPVSGFYGANIAKRSSEMGWYRGPTLLEAMVQMKLPSVFLFKGFISLPKKKMKDVFLQDGSRQEWFVLAK